MPLGQALRSFGMLTAATLSFGLVKARGAAKGNKRRRSGSMGQLFSIFMLTVAGLAIIFVAVWYVSAVRSWISPNPSSYILGEIEVVGDSELAEIYKKVLPRIINARLWKIRGEINEAMQALKEARDRHSGDFQTQSQESISQRLLPQPFTPPPDYSFKIAEVDVVPLISILSNALYQQNALEITVSIDSSNNSARIYGYLPGSSGYSFSESVEDRSAHSLGNAAATAIVGELLKRQDVSLAALGAHELNTLLEVLNEYARHLRTAPIRGEPSFQDFQHLNEQLRAMAPQFTRWRNLQWLAAEIAEQAKSWEDAARYYTNLVAITSGTPDHAFVERKLEHSERELAKIRVARSQAKEEGISEEAALQNQRRDILDKASDVVAIDRAKPVLASMGMSQAGSAGGVKIGIAGLPWDEVIDGLRSKGLEVEILGGASAQEVDAAIADYLTELIQTIRLVADDPKFVFSPISSAEQGRAIGPDLIRSLRILRGNSDIILYAYATQERSQIMDDELKRLALFFPVVVSAGNRPEPSVYSEIADTVYLSGAVDLSGTATPFSSTGDRLLWAPGAEIPVISPRTGSVEERSGTAYSAALIAGAVAVLKKQFPNAKPELLRSVLVETSMPIEDGEGPPVINVPAAIAALKNMREPNPAGG